MTDIRDKSTGYGTIMIRIRHQTGWLLLAALFLLSTQHVFAAKYYVYQAADGSRVVTDRISYIPTYTLVKSTRKLDGVGQLAAGKSIAMNLHLIKDYDNMIEAVSNKHEVETALVKAVVHTESYFNAKAKSNKGATGLMQLMPQTAARYGVRNLRDPRQNLEAGVQHLRYLMEKYPSNLAHALAAYNAGEEAVHKYQGIPPYSETRHYVQKVMLYHEFYQGVN